jgi:hypothetical protein
MPIKDEISVAVRAMIKQAVSFGPDRMSLVTNEDGIPVPYTDNTRLPNGGKNSTPVTVGGALREYKWSILPEANSMISKYDIKDIAPKDVDGWANYINKRNREVDYYKRQWDGYHENSKPGIYPSIRPSVGPLSNRNVYSDKGKFYRVVLPGGRTTTIYLRNSGTPNLAVPSEGWTPHEANDIAALLFASKDPDIVRNGTVAGATADQISTEILGHDQLYRRTPTHNFFHLNWRDWSDQVLSMFKKEKDPLAVADIRALPKNPSWIQKKEQDTIRGAADRAIRDNKRGVAPIIMR